MKFNITTIAIGLALGFIIYRVSKKKTEAVGSTSKEDTHSSACGACGG
tara:strand:+ start:575 stop:718 length:144 start_codon:yes stop_codon:yes gene_type:complete